MAPFQPIDFQNSVDFVDIAHQVHRDAVEPALVSSLGPLAGVDVGKAGARGPQQVITEQIHGVSDFGEC